MITNQQAQDAAKLSYAVYGTDVPTGYTVAKIFDDPQTGFHAVIFQNGITNEYTVAITGTQPLTGTDELADLNVGLDQWKNNGKDVLDTLASLSPGKVTFTGHSLGGMDAQYAIYDWLSQPQNINATANLITFNASGAMEGLQDLHPNGINMSIGNRIDGAVFTANSSGRQDLVSRVGGAHFGGITYDVDIGTNRDIGALHSPWDHFFNVTIPSTSTPIQSVNLSAARRIAAAAAFILDDGDNSNAVEAFSRSAAGILLGLATGPQADLNQLGELLGNYLGNDNPVASAYNNLLSAYYSPDAPAADSHIYLARIALGLAGIIALDFSMGAQVGDIAVTIERKAEQILRDAVEEATGVASTILQKAYSRASDVLVSLITNHSNPTSAPQNPNIFNLNTDPVNLKPEAPAIGSTNGSQGLLGSGAGYEYTMNSQYVNEGGITNVASSNIATAGIRPGNHSESNFSSQVNAIRQTWVNNSQYDRISLPGVASSVDVGLAAPSTTGSGTTTLRIYNSSAPDATVGTLSGNYRYDSNGRKIGFDTADGKTYIEFLSTKTNPDGTITINSWANIEKDTSSVSLTQQSNANDPAVTTYTDPLTLDSDNGGISFSAASVNFDYNADSVAEALNWTAPTDPLLVLDKNGDGRINNGTELVDLTGDAAPTALFDLDSNGDKKLNTNDSAFNLLQIWSDRNQDGYASLQELKTLSELGIVNIDLDPTHIQTSTINGKIVRGVAATYQDGSTKVLWDVPFATDGSVSNPVTVASYSADIDKISSNGQIALRAMSSRGVNLNLTGSGATQAIGGDGNDTLAGSAGNDWLIGGVGSDKFIGGDGADLLVIDADDNLQDIDAGAGIDTVIIADDRGVFLNLAKTKTEVVYGGYGDDVLISGGSDNYFIDGADGDDLIVGGNADDVLSGADGEDLIQGGKGNDLIRGGRDNDELFGGEGNDVLDGGLGSDIIKGESGNDVIIASGGRDTVDGSSGTDLIQLSGALEDYVFEYQYKGDLIQKNGHWVKKPSWIIKDTKNLDGSRVDFSKGEVSDRNGIQILTDVERFSYMRGNIHTVMNLDMDNPLPVNDVIQGVNASQPIRINTSTLLGNDIDFGKINNPDFNVTKIVKWVGDAVGGSVEIDGSSGEVIFRPNSQYKGVMEFTYQIADWVSNVPGLVLTAPTIQDVANPSVMGEAKARVFLLPATEASAISDPDYVKQWYLGAINAQSAWSAGYTGKNIKVLVLDPAGEFATAKQVADLNHPDFAGRVSDRFSDTVNHSVHATTVAGVIGAGKNGIGGVGVAFDSTLNSISLPPKSTTLQEFRTSISEMKNYDVVNNSWNFTDAWDQASVYNSIASASIADAAIYGRNGLGSIMIFAAGNDRRKSYDASILALNSNPYAITIGAINRAADAALNGQNTPFSTRGTSILVSAPGSNIVTTGVKLTTSDGNTIGSSSTETQGTSLAAPIVSGVVALMLQANPNLSYRDVQTILAVTARKDYSNSAQSDTTWSNNANFDWNGSGMHFSHDFGFGMVDAAAAVRMAENWLTQGTEFVNTQAFASNQVQSINDNGNATLSFNVSGSQTVEQARLNLQLNHAQWSDLRITLTSPRGTSSILLDRPGVVGDQQFMNNPDEVTFFDKSLMSTHFRGELATGTWQLKIEDLSPNGKATTNIQASLDLISGEDNHLKRYILTDEYSGGKVFGAVDVDMTGELNTAAVSSNATINLDTRQGTFNGKVFTFGSGIDRLVSGGGNDSLIGSSQNEAIWGGQGNDTINGGDGHDRLDGGAGDDNLFGGDGQDILIGGIGNDSLNGGAGGDVFLIDGVSDQSSTTITDFNTSQGDVVIVRMPSKLAFDTIEQSLNGTQLTLSYPIGDDLVRKIILQNVTSKLTSKQLLTYSQDQEISVDPVTGAASGNAVYVTPKWTLVKQDPTPFESYAYDFYATDDFVPIGVADQFKLVHYSEHSATARPGQQIVIGYGNLETRLIGNVLVHGYPKSMLLPSNVLSASWSGGKVIATAYTNGGQVSFKIEDMQWTKGTAQGEVLRVGNISPVKPTQISDYEWQLALESLGKPKLEGLGGGDEIYGSYGAEILDGGAGADTLIGGAGDDEIYGGSDNDLIVGGAGNDYLSGGSGEDTFSFNIGDGSDQIVGYDQYSDTLLFQNTPLSSLSASLSFTEVSKDGLRINTLLNYGNADSIKFSSRVNVGDFAFPSPVNHYRFKIDSAQTQVVALTASEMSNKSDLVVQEKLSTKNVDLLSGNDAYYALYTNQVNVRAGEGNDSLFVFSGGNSIHGDAGDDRIELQNSTSELTDYIYGDAGNDIIIGANVAAYIDGGADNDNITGSSKNDQLFGGDGDDSLYGGAGNDSLNGGIGSNRLYGGDGNDILDGIASTLIAQSSSDFAAYLYGEQGNDTLNGSDQRDFLDGGIDNDSLEGGAGDDVLLGGDGDDTLVGGSGDDLILSGSGADVIKLGLNSGRDFLDSLSGQDTIQIDGILGSKTDFILDKSNAFSKIKFSWHGSDTSTLSNSVTLSNYNWGTNFKFVAPDGNVSVKTLRQIFEENGYQVNEDFDFLDQYDTQLTGLSGTSGVLIGGENDDQLFGGPITNSVTENSELNGIRFNGNANYWYVVGRDGEDSIAGGYSGAIIDGGLGDDVIRGSNNVKVVSDTNFGGMDKIVLPEGITPEMLQYVRIQNPLEQAFMKLLKSSGVSYNYQGSIAEVIQSLNSADSLKLAQTLGQTSFGTRYLGDDRGTVEGIQLSGWPSLIGNPNSYFVPHFDTLRLQTADGKFVLDIVGFYENGKFKNNIGNLVFSSAFDSFGQTLNFDLTALAKSKVKANRYSLDGGYFFQEYVVDRYGYPGRYVPAEVSIFNINPQLPSNSNSTKLEVKFDFDADTSVYVGANLSEALYGTTSYYSQTSQFDLVTDKQRYSGSNNIYLKARSDVILGNDGDDTLYGGGSFIQFFSTDNSLFHQYSSAQLFGNYLFNIPNAYNADDWGYITQRYDFNKSGEGLNYLRIYSGFMYDTLNGGDGNDKYIYRYGDGILKVKSIDIADAGAKGWDTLSLTDFKIEDVIIRPLENRYDGALDPRSYLDYLSGYYPSDSLPVWAGGLEIIVPVKYDSLGKPIYSYIHGNNRSSEFGYIANGRIYVDSGINGQYHVDEITFKGGVSLNVHEWIKEQISTVKPAVVNSSVYGINFYNTSISTIYGINNYGEEYARKLNLAKSSLIGATPFSDLVNIDRNGFYAGFEGADQYVYQGLPSLAVIFWDKGDILSNLSFEYASNDYKFVGETLNQQSVMGKTKAEWIASGILPYTSNFSSETYGTGLKLYDPNYSLQLGNYVMTDSASLDIKNWQSLDDKQELANDVLITTFSYGSNGEQIVSQQIILIGGAVDIERRWFDLQSNKITGSFPYASEGNDYISIFDTSSSATSLANEKAWYDLIDNPDGIIDFDLERTIYALGGNDTIDAFAEDVYVQSANIYVGYRDKIYAGAGNDSVRSGADDDTLYGGSGNDLLDGGYGDDLLVGGIGNDTLIGGQGVDILNGGSGDDVYYAEQSDILFERPDEGHDTVISEGDFRLDISGAENIENLTLIGSGEFSGQGNALNNIINGNQSKNVLNGLAGEDTLIGQGGDDTYYVDDERDVVIETAENGYDQINSSVTYTLSANVEALLLTGISNINGYGNTANNRITGNDADNVLNGGGGDDTLTGGYGNDTYIVDSLSDVIIERKYGGIDKVISSVSLTLGSNLENLTLIGNSPINGTGNSLDNLIVGNDATNILKGEMGSDTLVGGGGNDIYVVGQLLEGWENYIGKEIPEDVIVENTYSDSEVDVLRVGIDTSNLSWVDFYRSIERSGDDLLIFSNKEYDTEWGGIDGLYKRIRVQNYFLGREYQVEKIEFSDGIQRDISQMLIEQGYQFNGTDDDDVMNGSSGVRLMFGGLGNDYINGDAGSNTIYGEDGDDTLSGGAGNDQLDGGLGNDTYIFSRGDGIDVANDSSLENEVTTIKINANSNEVKLTRSAYFNGYTFTPPAESSLTIEFVGNGADKFTFNSWWNSVSSNANRRIIFNDSTLDLNSIENLLQIMPTTNNADLRYGSGRNDTLSGMLGNDLIFGLAGNDLLNGNEGNDVLYGDDGNDKIYGGVGNDRLYGGTGQDSLYGGDGNDLLDGGEGADYLDGGLGNNTYYIDHQGDVVIGNGTIFSDLQTYVLANGQKNAVQINKGLNVIGNAESNSLVGNDHSNYIAGNDDIDYLRSGDAGLDILQGGNGDDSLERNANGWNVSGNVGNALLDGGAGNDYIFSRYLGPDSDIGNDILLGGTGNDVLYAGDFSESYWDDGQVVDANYGFTGHDVVLFNVGDGQDTLYAGGGQKLTLSIGKLINYEQLSLTKEGDSLVLNVSTSDKITLFDWYKDSLGRTKSIANLQVIAETIQGFSEDSTNDLRNNTIETFNFANVVAAFDTAGAQANWQLTESRLSAHLKSGSNTEAIGGDIAYHYGKNSNLTNMGLNATQVVLSDINFGKTTQTFSTSIIGTSEAIKLS